MRAFRAVGRNPLFIQKGHQDWIQDADGREYLDYVMSWGPLVLGHARQEVLEAVADAVKNGLTFVLPHSGKRSWQRKSAGRVTIWSRCGW